MTLVSLIGGGVVLTLILMRGAGNPPPAGTLISTDGPFSDLIIGQGSDIRLLDIPPIMLPNTPPYSLEISAILTPSSDSLAGWGIALGDFSIFLTADTYMRVPRSGGASRLFHHIRSVGQENTALVTVDRDGKIVVWINRELAWQGQIASVVSVRQAQIIAQSPRRDAGLHIRQIAIYGDISAGK